MYNWKALSSAECAIEVIYGSFLVESVHFIANKRQNYYVHVSQELDSAIIDYVLYPKKSHDVTLYGVAFSGDALYVICFWRNHFYNVFVFEFINEEDTCKQKWNNQTCKGVGDAYESETHPVQQSLLFIFPISDTLFEMMPAR